MRLMRTSALGDNGFVGKRVVTVGATAAVVFGVTVSLLDTSRGSY